MDGRRVSISAVVAAIAVLTASVAGAGAADRSSFSGKPSVADVDALCVSSGKDRGSVFVHVAIRYPDAAADAASGFARHTVESRVAVRDSGDKLIARDRDRGRAQVDIPEITSYLHTHQHQLSKSESARVLDGKRCTSKTATSIKVAVKARQRLTAAGRSSRAASTSATSASQSTSSGATTALEGASSAPGVENGCVYDTKGQIDCSGAFLQKVSFVGERFPYGNFSFANLLGADLSGVALGHVTMNKTILDQANMRGALLGVASLTDASLIETDLTGAQLPFANLANARFAGAALGGADLIGANLAGTVFENSQCDANTRFPTAFTFTCEGGAIVRK